MTTVYVPNTGSMLNLVPPQLVDPLCVLSVAPSGSKRKYQHTMEMIQVGKTFVGIHSALANKMVANALRMDLIPECRGFSSFKQEIKIEDAASVRNKKKTESRIDFELIFGGKHDAKKGTVTLPSSPIRKRKRGVSTDASDIKRGTDDVHDAAADHGVLVADISQRMLLEVKSVTLAPYDGLPNQLAEFPDSVSVRAKKHAECLTHHVRSGGRAALLFLIQRSDCSSFTISPIDAAYKLAVSEAKQAGVLILPYVCRLNPDHGTVELVGRVPFLE
jgi:DNA-binding sugar fermentation-stimulating protein